MPWARELRVRRKEPWQGDFYHKMLKKILLLNEVSYSCRIRMPGEQHPMTLLRPGRSLGGGGLGLCENQNLEFRSWSVPSPTEASSSCITHQFSCQVFGVEGTLLECCLCPPTPSRGVTWGKLASLGL